MLTFDDPLCARDLLCDHRMAHGGRRIVVACNEPACEQPAKVEADQQVVLEADEEAGLSGITLAARAAPQLMVDAPALVPIGAYNV